MSRSVGERKTLSKCLLGAEIILPSLGPATVIVPHKAITREGNVTVLVEGDRLAKSMQVRGGLMVIDTGVVSPNFGGNPCVQDDGSPWPTKYGCGGEKCVECEP